MKDRAVKLHLILSNEAVHSILCGDLCQFCNFLLGKKPIQNWKGRLDESTLVLWRPYFLHKNHCCLLAQLCFCLVSAMSLGYNRHLLFMWKKLHERLYQRSLPFGRNFQHIRETVLLPNTREWGKELIRRSGLC